MWRGGICLILFHKPGFGLDDAFRVLSAELAGSSVISRNRREVDGAEVLVIQPGPGSELKIALDAGPGAQRQAAGLGKATRHAEAMGQCDALFWISVEDVRAALKDRDGLAAVQKLLLQATGGFLYSTWDDRVYSAAEFAS
jgi:hypothetical protein